MGRRAANPANSANPANPKGSVLRERADLWLRVDPRPVPGARIMRTLLRTAHLIAAGALYGGHVYGVEAERLVPALAATRASFSRVATPRIWISQTEAW